MANKNMLEHTFICGASGSGKSYAENLIVHHLIEEHAVLMLIDPKMVELMEYKDYAESVGGLYADNSESAKRVLVSAVNTMNERLAQMQRDRIKKSNERPVYVVVDEYGDLIADKKAKKFLEPMFATIAMKGRAANVYLLLCSQYAQRSIMSSTVTQNMMAIVSLRQRKAVDYRTVLDCAVNPLPKLGYCYILRDTDLGMPKKVKTDDVWEELVNGD